MRNVMEEIGVVYKTVVKVSKSKLRRSTAAKRGRGMYSEIVVA